MAFHHTGWAIQHWRQGFYVDSVRNTRREAIAYFKATYGVSDREWRDDVRYGVHRAVKVFIEKLRSRP